MNIVRLLWLSFGASLLYISTIKPASMLGQSSRREHLLAIAGVASIMAALSLTLAALSVAFLLYLAFRSGTTNREPLQTLAEARRALRSQRRIDVCAFIALLGLNLFLIMLATESANKSLSEKVLVFVGYPKGGYGLWELPIVFFAAASYTVGSAAVQNIFWIGSLLNKLTESENNESFLTECIRSGEVFAIYLRDFAGEQYASESQDAILPGPSGSTITIRSTSRRQEIERLVLRDIGMPVFCFANWFDFVEHADALAVPFDGRCWRETFADVASKAAIIVVLLESSGEGINFELNWLTEHQSRAQVIVAGSTKILRDLKGSRPQLLGRAFVKDITKTLEKEYPLIGRVL